MEGVCGRPAGLYKEAPVNLTTLNITIHDFISFIF